MTEYIKTATIDAEQFDGSEAMIKKYSIRLDEPYQIAAEPDEFVFVPFEIETREAWLKIEVGDWVATGVKGEHWPIADEIFKQTYQKLPAIPAEIDTAIKAYRKAYGDNKGLTVLLLDWQQSWALGVLSSIQNMPYDLRESYRFKSDLIARAWLDGYEIDDKS